jgi:biotin carboxyl carrier protein
VTPPAGSSPARFAATIGSQTEPVSVGGGPGRYRVAIGGDLLEIDARLSPGGIHSLLVDGRSYVVHVHEADGVTVVEIGDERYEISVEEEARYVIRIRGGAASAAGGQVLRAPMPGKVTHVAVSPGDTVDAGASLVVIEAMKMENEFRAKAAGTVKEVCVQAGQAVNAGDVLLVIG